MAIARKPGPISLGIAVGGFVSIEAALRTGLVAGSVWRVIADAFEAGTVGGVADWFAVTALFREVPIPILRRHTNIIVKNRARIVDGIADVVQNKWLSPQVIREYLARMAPSDLLIDTLGDPSKQARLLELLRELLGKSARSLDGPEFSGFLRNLMEENLNDLELHKPLGRWVANAIRRGDHHAVWDLLFKSFEKSLESPEVVQALHRLFREAVASYKDSGFLRRVALDAAEFIGLLDGEEAVSAILGNLEGFVREAGKNPSHPVRARLDALLLEFADGLSAGDPESVAALETMKRRLTDSDDLGAAIQRLLARLVATVRDQLASPESELSGTLSRFLDERLREFRHDKAACDRFDSWVRETATELVETRHDAIGEMVRGSLDKLNDLDLVTQIEEKVGPDLQYIRLNGAVVGAVVGCLLSILRLAIN